MRILTGKAASNIPGSQNVIDMAQAIRVVRVTFTSSDKVVKPAKVMDTSKLMGKRVITVGSLVNLGAFAPSETILASSRFGSVTELGALRLHCSKARSNLVVPSFDRSRLEPVCNDLVRGRICSPRFGVLNEMIN